MSLQNPLDTELARRGGVNGLIASIKKVLAFYFPKPTGKSTDYIRGDGSIAPFPTVSGSTYNPTAGTGISITGTSPNQTITNTLPDQTVALTAGTGIGVAGTYPNFTISNTSPSSGGTVTSIDVDAGTGISVSPAGPITTSGTFTVTNTAPDQIVSISSGTGISSSGTYPNFTIANTAPDQVVAITGGTGIGVSGAYPNFTITNNDPASGVSLSSAGGTQTLVNDGTGPSLATKGLTAGTGVSLSSTATDVTITNSAPDQVVSLGTTGSGLAVTGSYPSFTLQNTLPDQTVALTAGTGIGITGTYPNFTITNSSPSSGGTVTAVTASAPMASTGGTAPNLSMPQSGAAQDGYLSSTDWNTFNSKQDALTLTTTGTSGAATLIGSTLNIPQYSGGGGASIVRLTGQTLTAASWTLVSGYYTYTFSNVNITVNTRVDFTPDNTSYLEVTTCGMQTQVTVAAGSCTFFSLFPPQTNITGEVTIFPTI
jgi:hypothetical protein